MATTYSSALAAAITFKVQKNILRNLRAKLVFADPQYAVQGSFNAGFDTLTFVDVPDLAVNTTPLDEGTAPTARAMSIATVSVSTAQYGDLVEITEIAKVKSPIEIADIASERLSRQAPGVSRPDRPRRHRRRRLRRLPQRLPPSTPVLTSPLATR